jgi:transposase-like protein
VAEAAAIYRANSASAAQRAFRHWQQHWQARRPRAVACLEQDLDQLLSFLSVPKRTGKKCAPPR